MDKARIEMENHTRAQIENHCFPPTPLLFDRPDQRKDKKRKNKTRQQEQERGRHPPIPGLPPPWNRTVRAPGGSRPGAPFSVPHLIPMVTKTSSRKRHDFHIVRSLSLVQLHPGITQCELTGRDWPGSLHSPFLIPYPWRTKCSGNKTCHQTNPTDTRNRTCSPTSNRKPYKTEKPRKTNKEAQKKKKKQ